MRKKYVSPLFAELELEDVLNMSPADNVGKGNEWEEDGEGNDGNDNEENPF